MPMFKSLPTVRTGLTALLLMAVATATAAPAGNQVKPVDKASFTRLADLFKQRIGVAPDSISTSEIPGLYEALIGDKAFYVTPDGKYLVEGILVDFAARKNMTEARTAKLRAIDIKTLPLADAMKTVRGNGSRILVTMEDPNCGYCKKLAPELEKLNNVTIYRFLTPILGPDSVEKARAVWCAKDRDQAWAAYMSGGSVPNQACDTTAIDRNLQLTAKLRVSGTPTMVFANSERVPGYIPADEIEKKLSAK